MERGTKAAVNQGKMHFDDRVKAASLAAAKASVIRGRWIYFVSRCWYLANLRCCGALGFMQPHTNSTVCVTSRRALTPRACVVRVLSCCNATHPTRQHQSTLTPSPFPHPHTHTPLCSLPNTHFIFLLIFVCVVMAVVVPTFPLQVQS